MHCHYQLMKDALELTALPYFVEKRFLNLLAHSRTRMNAWMQRKMQNTKNTLKTDFFDELSMDFSLYILAFCTGKSERSNILDLLIV